MLFNHCLVSAHSFSMVVQSSSAHHTVFSNLIVRLLLQLGGIKGVVSIK